MPSSTDCGPKGFRQRHPVLFVFGMLIVAMTLTVGVMAFFASPEDEGERLISLPDSEKLGVATLEGTIDSSERMVAFLRKLRDDSSVKGVLLRVNSGGGGFGPSQEIFFAVQALAQVKPVVASFGSTAASGGYYSACPAKVIYALPGTITGSIGVLSRFPNLSGVSEKLGFTYNSFTSGKLKDAGSPFRPITPEDKAYLSGLIRDLHDIFVGDVARSRNLDPKAIDALQGKAMTGLEAKNLGLVDAIGTQEDALEALRRMAGIERKHPSLIKGPKKDQRRWDEFMGMLGASFVQGMAQGMAESARQAASSATDVDAAR